MSKFCNRECKDDGSVCDFCRFYNFNSNVDGAYIGKGYCTWWEHSREPEDGCNEFICMNYKVIKSALDRKAKITDVYCNYLKKNKKKKKVLK